MHQIFLDWIMSQKGSWKNFNIKIDKVIDQIVNIENPDFPYVAVHHSAQNGLGEIALHRVNGGYILEFQAGKIDNDKFLAYCCEFTDNPHFDFWQEKYIAFLRSK